MAPLDSRYTQVSFNLVSVQVCGRLDSHNSDALFFYHSNFGIGALCPHFLWVHCPCCMIEQPKSLYLKSTWLTPVTLAISKNPLSIPPPQPTPQFSRISPSLSNPLSLYSAFFAPLIFHAGFSKAFQTQLSDMAVRWLSNPQSCVPQKIACTRARRIYGTITT